MVGDLERFLVAQARVLDAVRSELRSGRKRSHWMWFVFPQVAGLGVSETARYYAIAGLSEAQAYAAHDVLGARLRECVGLVLAHGDSIDPIRMFGAIDAAKLRSSLTLFEVATGDALFAHALDRLFAGQRDDRTLAMLMRR